MAFADAPVSGGTNGAEAGTLTVMVGADAPTFERARPVLAAFGRRIEHVGPVGAGDALKAVNNALLALNILAVGEGMAALVKAGVPARRALEVINASSGRSFVSDTLVPERVLTGAWPRTFRLALLDKDVAIATDLLVETGVEGPVLERCAGGAPRRAARARRDGRLSRSDRPHRAARRRGDSRLMPTCRDDRLSAVSGNSPGQRR